MDETMQEQRKLAARKILEEEARLAKLTRLAEEEIIAKEKEDGALVSSPERSREGIGSIGGGGAMEEIAKFSKQLKARTEGKNQQHPPILSPQQELRAITQARPIVVCGPSGVGKGTIINLLMERFPGNPFGFSVSHTTRKPRDNEIDGLHYHFTDIHEMKSEIDNKKFIEFAEVHGNYYGTSFESVRSVQRRGQICILDIDVQGARNVKRSDLNAYFLFIAPPSMEELELRLRGMGTESEEDIKQRLEDAPAELEYGYEAGNFDRIVINNNLETAAMEISSIIKEWYPTLIEDINCQVCTIS